MFTADGALITNHLSDNLIPKSFVCLYDPDSVMKAKNASIGENLIIDMGGKTNDLQGPPLKSEIIVKGLFDGVFQEKTPRHGGFTNFDQGITAVVTCKSGLTVMLTSKRMAPYSLEQLRSCNLEPENFNVLVAKGVNSPIAAYDEICSQFIRVDTPGVTASNLEHFKYQNRRLPMYPFEKNFKY